MTLLSRIEKVEDSLNGRQRLLVWLEQARMTAGFVEYWERELSRNPAPFSWLSDPHVHFLFLLLNNLNLTVLRHVETSRSASLFALFALRQFLKGEVDAKEQSILIMWRTEFLRLREAVLVLEAATQEISQTYFDSRPVLFADADEALKGEIARIRAGTEAYNLIAAKFALDIINDDPVPEPKVQAKMYDFVTLARIEVLRHDQHRRAEVMSLIRSGLQKRPDTDARDAAFPIMN